MKTVNIFSLLKSMLLSAPKNDVRYYMNGVNIYKHETSIVISVTDGCSLLRVELNGNEDDVIQVDQNTNVTLDYVSLTKILKMSNIKNPPILTINEGIVYLDNYEVETIDGRFPDINRVLKSRTAKNLDGNPQGVNLKLLIKLSKSISMLTECSEFTMHSLEGFKLYRETEAGTITALLMPTRI